MRLLAISAVVATFAVSPYANAGSVDELFQQFGLFGTWAADCSKPATPSNPRVSITTPSAGLVLEDHNLGPDFSVNRYSVLSAERVSASSISVEVIFQPGTELEQRQKLVFSVHDNTRRTMFNQADGGTVRVKDGVALARGTKTPVLRRCEADGVSR
jgi:hypothetical protein